MQKILSAFLAFLVLVSVFFPCSDSDIGQAGKAETFITAASDCGGHHAEDACSPFCTCTCCVGFIIPQAPVISLKPLLVLVETTFLPYFPAEVKEVMLPIWQPPQLV